MPSRSRSPSAAPRTRTNPEPSNMVREALHLQIHDVRCRTHRPTPVPAPTRAHRAVSPHLDQRDTAARNSSPRMPVRDGPPRYCGTGPAGSPPAGDGRRRELPRTAVRRELHEPNAPAAREPKPFSGQRRQAAVEAALTGYTQPDAIALSLISAGHRTRRSSVLRTVPATNCRRKDAAVT
jgi:hypothetical protein